MDAPPSSNHVFNFPEDEFEEDHQEDPEEEFKEDPEEELDVEAEDDVPPPVTLPVGSPITPPLLSESSSDTEDVAPIVANEALEMPPIGSLYEAGGPSSVSPFPPFYRHGHEIARLDYNTELLLSNVKYLEQCEKKRKVEMEANNSELSKEKAKEMEKMKKRLGMLEKNCALVLSDRDEWKKAFYNLQAWVSERFGQGAMDARLYDGVNGSAAFRESKPPKPPGSPSSSQIMPPKMMKRKDVKKMVKKRIAEAIEEYEKTRANPGNACGSGSTNIGRSMNVQGCTHKTFMNGKPHPFNRTEGVVGLRKKIERYTKGFPERIKGNITSLRPITLHDAINLACKLVEQAVQGKAARVNESNKRKQEEHQKNHPNNNNPNNCNRNNNNQHHQQNRRQETGRAYAVTPAEGRGYNGNLPWCHKYKAHHQQGPCPPKCSRCIKVGHQEKDCWVRIPATGAERSFVSIEFTPFINISPVALNTSYEVELADGKIVVLTLALEWLSYHQAVIVCYEKIVRIPFSNGEILKIQGERPKKDLKSLSCIKADEKRLDDIRTVRDFPEVFPDDLTGHMVNRDRIHVDPRKVESVKNWKTHESPTEIRSFLRLGAYVWGDKQEEAFRILKEKLCNAPVLALPDGPNDFVVYCDASNQGFRCVLMQRGKIWIPSVGGIRKFIMDEAYTFRYLVHPGADKMYYDLRDLYWWPGKKRDIAEYVSKCLTLRLASAVRGDQIFDKLYFVEEPIEIVDRQVKKLKRSWIPIVKVRWDSQRGAEFTWEREDQFKAKYSYLFATSLSVATAS
uniref:Putative reverse transcriptase domain-containing protein n=1 Tax=Tanacetum cinerariifolium TaxID=118510 RepID=A0A6L2KQ75_TANCI|nr:putative reverse transcriptase domain-containing protein [Tanacetum cinerariifolium]GEU90930.1 putative reverse transcriptase domain-containing protein [Tanacetum cinerariifolium]